MDVSPPIIWAWDLLRYYESSPTVYYATPGLSIIELYQENIHRKGGDILGFQRFLCGLTLRVQRRVP